MAETIGGGGGGGGIYGDVDVGNCWDENEGLGKDGIIDEREGDEPDNRDNEAGSDGDGCPGCENGTLDVE